MKPGSSALDVVITGIGVISAPGVGSGPLARALAREGAVAPGPACGHAFDPDAFIDPNRSRRMDPLSMLAVAAAGLAARQAGFARPLPGAPDPRLGVVFGTSFGCQATELRYAQKLVAQGAHFTNPIDFPDSIDGAPAAHVALELGVGGPSSTHADGALAGEHALLHAVLDLASGRADRVLAGAGDVLTPALDAARRALGCASTAGRAGEGVACFALERRDDALARGAALRGSVLGIGQACARRCRRHRLPTSCEALVEAMRSALEQAGVAADAIDLVSCPGVPGSGADRLGRDAFAALSGKPPLLRSPEVVTGEIAAGGLVRLAASCLLLEASPERTQAYALLQHATSPGGASFAIVVGDIRPRPHDEAPSTR